MRRNATSAVEGRSKAPHARSIRIRTFVRQLRRHVAAYFSNLAPASSPIRQITTHRRSTTFLSNSVN